jgi:hypothetical protein
MYLQLVLEGYYERLDPLVVHANAPTYLGKNNLKTIALLRERTLSKLIRHELVGKT